jgi:hypothetical protein
MPIRPVRSVVAFTALACSTPPGPPAGCLEPGAEGATARCLAPTKAPEHYVAEALRYFDTLDTSAPPDSRPDYGDTVARWEWPPWLKLTGYGAELMVDTERVLKAADPSTVPVRDCRFFPVQPFARCHVVMRYAEGPCPVYEEFVFNDAGQTTFIEAWSDVPGLTPTRADDPWGERDTFARLALRVPGLGFRDGSIYPNGAAMERVAATDPDVRDLMLRARDFWGTWFPEVQAAGPEVYARGCGW